MKLYVLSTDFEAPVPVEMQTFINDIQIRNLSMDPRSVKDFARFLKQEAILYNTNNPEIHGDIRVRYNGRDPVSFVDPSVDLAEVPYSAFKRLSWVKDVPR